MGRKMREASIQRIYTQRADNYAHHFECREAVKAMQADVRATLAHAVGHFPYPRLTLYGSTEYTRDFELTMITLANRIGMSDPWLLNPWYVTEAGWQVFQDAWEQLPEPVDFVPRKVCTKPESVLFVHSPDAGDG